MRRLLLVLVVIALAALLPLSVFGQDLSADSSLAPSPSPSASPDTESSRSFSTVQVIEAPASQEELDPVGLVLWCGLLFLLALLLCYMVYHWGKVRKDEKRKRMQALMRPKLIITRGFTKRK
jgi:hypothetical protein